MSFKNLSSSILLGAIALAAFQHATVDSPSGNPFSPPNKSSWIGILAMGLFVKKLLGGQGKLLEGGSALPRDSDEYDFVIVGGGTAGCVLAARLSEDPNARVLLLEAGGSGKALMFSRIPAAFSLLFHSKHVYQLYTEPHPDSGGKRKFWPRGKMLGGCSSINAQMAHYGAPADFDRWAEIIGDDSWKWENFQTSFRKFETYVPSPDYPDVDLSLKGKDGPMRVGYFSYVSEASTAFIKAAQEVGIEYSPDFNTHNGTLGVNKMMTYIDESRTRVSSESAYLTDEVLARPNLKVVINATVTQILTEKVGEEVKAVGVEFAKSVTGTRYRVKSKREVIVSSGSIHSPQILMLSGIGPAEELAKHDIPVVQDLPGVGGHLLDHVVVDIFFHNKSPTPKYVKPQGLLEAVKLVGSIVQYFVTRKGGMTTNFGESAAFVRSDDPQLFSEGELAEPLLDSTSGKGSPDLEIFTTPFAYKEHGDVMFPMETFAIHAVLLRPQSKGSLQLKSKDPWDLPIVNANYLSNRDDVKRLIRGLRLVLKISQKEPLSDHLIQPARSGDPLDHDMHLKSDEELEQVIRDRVETLYHPTSTCRMAPKDQGGVVDSHLRVYGVKGLRVCDASIFPEIVSGHTAGASLAAAERLSEIIKGEMKG